MAPKKEGPAAWIAVLDDAKASRDAKERASAALVDAGKASIGPLVARLQEKADPVYLDKLEVDRGPMNAGPTMTTTVSVKWQVEALLYRIVWPADASPALAPYAFVKDWASWWKRHEKMSLDEIRASSRAELDRLRAEIESKATPSP